MSNEVITHINEFSPMIVKENPRNRNDVLQQPDFLSDNEFYYTGSVISKMSVNPNTHKVEESLRCDFECTSLSIVTGGANNEYFYYGCSTSNAPGSRHGMGYLSDLKSQTYDSSILYYDFFKIGKIGYNEGQRLLFCDNSGFKCHSIYLMRHDYNSNIDTHSLVTMNVLDISSSSHFIYGYSQIEGTNSNYVFGKLESIYKIWIIEMSQSSQTISFVQLNSPGVYEPSLNIYPFGLTNNNLIKYTNDSGQLKMINCRYGYNKIALIGLPQMLTCPTGCVSCSSKTVCTVCEDGYNLQQNGECFIYCPEGTQNKNATTCIPIGPALKLSQKYWDKDLKSANFIFDMKIKSLDITNLEIKFPQKPILNTLQKELTLLGNQKGFKVEFPTMNQHINQEQLVIVQKNICTIKSDPYVGSIRCYPNNLNLEISYYSTQLTDSIAEAQKAVTISLQGLGIAFILVNAPQGIIILKLFQMFDYLKLVNVELPLNVIKFLQWFEDNMFDVIPNYLETNDQIVGCNPHYKLLESKFSCLVVNNVGTIFQENAIYIVMKILILMISVSWRSLRKFKNNKKSRGNGKVNFNDCLGLNFFYYMALALELDILVATLANIRSTGFHHSTLAYNTILSYIVTVAYLIWSIFCILRIHQLKFIYQFLIYGMGAPRKCEDTYEDSIISPTGTQQDQNKQQHQAIMKVIARDGEAEEEKISHRSGFLLHKHHFRIKNNGSKQFRRVTLENFKEENINFFRECDSKYRRWLFIMEGFRLQNHMELFFPMAIFLKDIILPIFFVSFLEMPYFQLIFPMLNCLAIIVLVRKYKPFANHTKINPILIINEGIYFLLLLSFILMHSLRNHYTEEEMYTFFGWTLIGLLCLVILINVITNAVESFYIISEWVSTRKQKPLKRKMIQVSENTNILDNNKKKNSNEKSKVKMSRFERKTKLSLRRKKIKGD